MRVCGVDIKGSEAILCVMEFTDGLMALPDCRTVRVQLVKDQDTDSNAQVPIHYGQTC